ncbi:MAG: ATP-binding cassette domain-containing protein [Actinomycetota bacterium]
MSDTVLRLSGLRAGYAGVAVVHDLDLEVAAGEVVALLGPNGAGKTTTLKTVSGLLPVLGGEVEVLGEPIPGGRAHRVARRGVGHVTEDRSLFFALTVRENLRLVRGGPGSRRERTDAVLDVFPELVPLLDRRAGLLSGHGQHLLLAAREEAVPSRQARNVLRE